MRRSGFTAVEVVVASGLSLLVLVVLYAFLARVFSSEGPSVSRMTAASFVRQDVRLAFEKLMGRLEESIEVLAPAPGDTATELEFKDLLNHHTVLSLKEGGHLVSSRVQGANRTEELDGKTVPGSSGAGIMVTRPVRVPGVRSIRFTALSPTMVSIVMTVVDGNQSGTLVATARLRNFRAVEN